MTASTVKHLALVGSCSCGFLGILVLTLNAALPVPGETTSKTASIPELPLLTACEEALAGLAPTTSNVRISLRDASIAQPVDVAWIDLDSLLVTTDDPPRNGARQVPIYVWPLRGSPSYATLLGTKTFRFGDTSVNNGVLMGANGQLLYQVMHWMDTIVTSKGPTIRPGASHPAAIQTANLPPTLSVPDFGAPDPEGGRKGHPNEISIYNADGGIMARSKYPPEVFVYRPNEYYIRRDALGWTVAVATAETERAARSNDRAATDLVILRCPTGDGAARVVQRVAKGPSLLRPALQHLNADPQHVQDFSALEHPAYSPPRRRWLFRKVEETDIVSPESEMAAFAELWSCDANGANRHLLDIQGWYNGPGRHQYAFFIQDGQVKEQFRRFKNWGPSRELLPVVSPDGTKVAYTKDNVIQIREIP